MPVGHARVRVLMDHAQSRLKRGLGTFLAQGSWPGVGDKRSHGWDAAVSSADSYVDPVTFTLMLRPSSQRAAFYTSNAGDYAKLGVSDFSGLTAASWEENDKTGVGGSKFLKAMGVNETGTTTADWPVNTSFAVSFFPYGEGSEAEVLRFGWRGTGSSAYTSGVAFRLYSTGKAVLYKDGLVVGEYQFSGNSSESKELNRWVTLTCLAVRHRELLVVTDSGEGFSHLFDDLDEQDADPAVLPAGKFWFLAPSPAVADVQIHRVKFPTSAVAYSVAGQFADAPETDQNGPLSRVYGSTSGGTATGEPVTPALGAFVANGVQRDVRAKVSMSGSGTRTPSVYGCLIEYEGTLEDTADAEVDVTEYVTSLSLSVGETPDSTYATVALGRLDTLETETGLPGVRTGSDRPVKILVGDVVLLDGRVDRLDVEYGMEPDLDIVTFIVGDPWSLLDLHVYRDPLPLDTVPMETVIKALATSAGHPTGQVDIDDPGFAVPSNGAGTSGEWNAVIEVGDRPGDWLKRTMDNYAGDWFYRFVPRADGVFFVAKPPEALDVDPATTLWPNWGDAVAQLEAEGLSPETAAKHGAARAYREYRETVVPSEATEVRVTGVEPRTGQPAYQAYFVDDDAEARGTDPGSRPLNWRGRKIVAGWVDTLLTSQALVESAARFLGAKLTSRRLLAEWECGYVEKPDGAPLWPGDAVEIEPNGTFRVTGLSVDFVFEPEDDGDELLGSWLWRTATYQGELVESEGQPWRGTSPVPGLEAARVASIRSVQDREAQRAIRDAVQMMKRGPIARVQVP